MKTNHSILIILFMSIQIAKADYWTQKADYGGSPVASAIGFSISNKGYIGLGISSGGSQNDFWEYDPSLNQWTQKTNFGGTARHGATAFSLGSKGYVGLGSDINFANDFWEYDPITDLWIQKTSFPASARAFASGFSIYNKGYIACGIDASHPVGDLWEYDSALNSWTQKSSVIASPGGFFAAVSFVIGNKGHITTGYGVSQTYEYDPINNSWSLKTGCPLNAYACAGFAIGVKGYAGTGFSTTNQFWEYNSGNNSWIQKTNFGGLPRLSATAFSIGNKGYLGTGQNGNTFYNDFWEYTPDTTTAINELTNSNTTSIHPNPCHGSFTFSYQNLSPTSIFKMMDVTGKPVYTQTITGIEGTQKINASGLSDGVYYYEVVSDKKIMGVGKMVVIK